MHNGLYFVYPLNILVRRTTIEDTQSFDRRNKRSNIETLKMVNYNVYRQFKR